MERKDFNYTSTDKAPERIWAWDDKTPMERDKGWSACDAGTGSTEYIRADLHEAARAVISRLADERDQAINALSKAAEARGRAEGKLAASELPAIVDGWKARADKAEAEVERLRDILAEFRSYVIAGCADGTITSGGEHHNPIWAKVATALQRKDGLVKINY